MTAVAFQDPDREFRAVLAAAAAAGVRVYAVHPPHEPIVGPTGEEEDWDGWSCDRWPEVLGLSKGDWSPSPSGMGAARAGEVIWAADTCAGDDGYYCHWQALLHEVAHAAVADTRCPPGYTLGTFPVGDEADAGAWEWALAAAVFGPLSQQARAVRRWALDAGLDADLLRLATRLGAKPSNDVVAAGRAAWSTR